MRELSGRETIEVLATQLEVARGPRRLVGFVVCQGNETGVLFAESDDGIPLRARLRAALEGDGYVIGGISIRLSGRTLGIEGWAFKDQDRARVESVAAKCGRLISEVFPETSFTRMRPGLN